MDLGQMNGFPSFLPPSLSCHGLFPAPRSLLVEPFAPHKAQRSEGEGEGQAVRFETPPKSPSTAEVYSAR